jgi:splicing factor 3A subunit 3
MILEEQRFLHEDLERLEQGIADRVVEEPKHVSRLIQKLFVGLLLIQHRYMSV